jgi:hypothetical protein
MRCPGCSHRHVRIAGVPAAEMTAMGRPPGRYGGSLSSTGQPRSMSTPIMTPQVTPMPVARRRIPSWSCVRASSSKERIVPPSSTMAGIAAHDLPERHGHRPASRTVAWRRLQAWQDTGVWDRLHRLVLDELSDADVLD